MNDKDQKMPPSGWIVLDKPRGMGSTQGVSAVKRTLREGGYAKTKIGHGGTLDPLAEGVLPIALGEATKLAGRMLDATKTYVFTIQFGEETDTLDTEGEVIARSNRFPPLAAVAGVLDRFTGPIEQVPPAFSALKVDGKRAYDLARAGEDVELKARKVTIHALDFHRHAELVSASSQPTDTSEQDEDWTPKQVRGDGLVACHNFRCPAFLRSRIAPSPNPASAGSGYNPPPCYTPSA